MADLAELELRIRSVEVELAQKRLALLAAEGAKTQGAVSLLEKQFQVLNSTVQKFRIAGSLLAAGFITTRVANSALIRTIKDYETALVTLRHVAVDSTASLKEQEEQFKELEEAARNIGRTTAFSAVEAADALVILSKAGLDAKESIAATEPILALAQGQLISVEQAAQTVIAALQQFGIAAVDTSRVVDVLSETSNRTSTDVTNLGEALKFVGPIAAAMGQSLEQTASALGVLSNAGIQGSLAGTTLRGVLTALANPTDKAQKAIKSLDLSLADLNPSVNSLEEVIGKLRGALLSETEAADIFNRRNAATALILTENLDALSKLIKQQEAARGETLRLSRAQNDTLAGAFKRLSAAFKENVLNATAFKDALRSTTEFLIGVFQIFSGSADAITKANENLVAFVGAVKATTVAVGFLIAAMAINHIIQWANAIITAVGAIAKLNAVLKLNPLVAIASAATAAFFAIRELTGELKSAEEQFSKFGRKEDEDRFSKLAKDLKELNHQIEEAKKIGDFGKAADLARSKVAILESELSNITFTLKEDPNNAKIVFDTFQKIHAESIPLNRELAIETNIRNESQVRDKLGKEIRSNLDAQLDELVRSFPDFDRIRDKFSLDKVIPLDKLSLSDELRAKLQNQIDVLFDDIEKRAENSNVAKKGLLGFLVPVEPRPAIKQSQQEIKNVFDFVASEAAKLGDLGKFDQSRVFGPDASFFRAFVNRSKAELKELEEAAKSTFDELVPPKTEEDQELFDNLTKSAEKGKESIAELAAELRIEQTELRATIGLSELAAGAKRQEIEAINLIRAAKSDELKLLAIEKQETLARLNAAKRGEEGAKKRGLTIEGLEQKLGRLIKREQELTGTYDKELASMLNLIQGNKALAEAREKAEDAAKQKQDLRSTLIQNVQSLREEAIELDKKVRLLKSTSDADKRLIEIDAFRADTLRQLTQDQEDSNASVDDLISSLIKYESSVVSLTEEEKKLTDAQKETKKSTQAESDALAKITRDLGLELSLIGASNIEKEAAIRLRQISSNLITSENKAIAEQGRVIEGLRPHIEVTIRALDQARKAAQFGRDIARSFADPIKDLLKGGDLEDAARGLLERLFDIFIEATIFQPLEEKFAEIFGGSKAVQKIVATTTFVDEEQVAAATAAIDKVSTDLADKLDKSSKELGSAVVEGLAMSAALLNAAKELKRAFELFSGGPPGGAGRQAGPKQTEPITTVSGGSFFLPSRPALPKTSQEDDLFELFNAPATPRFPPRTDRIDTSDLEDLFDIPATPRFPERTERLSVQTTTLDIGEEERQVIIAEQSIASLARAIQTSIEQIRAGEVPGLEVSGQQIVRTESPVEAFDANAVNAVLNQLTAASLQLAQSFSPLPQTSANLLQAAAQMQSAAPQLDSAASKLASAVSGAGTPAATPGEGGGAVSFTTALFEQLFAKGKGILQSLLSGFFGFAVPFQKGGIVEKSTKLVEPFEKGGVLEKHFASGGTFTNKVVSKTTVAPLAMFGEAGPEAIMPLRKTGKGGLGVSAFLAGKEVSVLKLTRGGGGKLGVDFRSVFDDNKTKRFALGDVFDRDKNVNLSGSGPSPVTISRPQPSNTAQGEGSGQSFVFNNTYKFEKGVNPDEAFHRSRRQFESDLRNSTRRIVP